MEIRVVLVRPLYPRNIGAVARALSNMGGAKLVRIGGADLDEIAKDGAATAQDFLTSSIRYETWDAFESAEPPSLRLAFTARDGLGRRVDDVTKSLDDSSLKKAVIHLIFGPEDHGLSAEDIRHAHRACGLPTYGDNPSLNLAQAALLALFLIQDRWGGKRRPFRDERSSEPAEFFPDETLKEWLSEIEWTDHEGSASAFETLRRLLLAAAPDPRETRLLTSFLRKSLNRLRS